MSAAGVSKAVSRLEDGAGVRLLHRSTHAVSLTEDGETLLDYAKDAVRAARTFEEATTTAAGGGKAGVIRVTAAVGLARHVIAPLMGEFSSLHPDIRLDVRATNEIVDLADAGIDVALRSGPLAAFPGHLQRTWFGAPWVICTTPTYLARRATPKSIAELDTHTLIGFRNQRTGSIQPWPYKTEEGESGRRYEPRPALTFDDGDAAWGAMLAGAGIACAPLWFAADALRKGAAVELLAANRDADVSIAILRRDRRLTPPRVTTFVEFLSARAPRLDDLL